MYLWTRSSHWLESDVHRLMPHLLVSTVLHTPTQPPPPPPPSSVFQFLYIKMERFKQPPNPVWFHPPWPHMGLWSAVHPQRLAVFLYFTPTTLVWLLLIPDLTSEFTPCSTRKAGDKVSGSPWRCWAKRYCTSCVHKYTRTHIHVCTELCFTTWAGAAGSGVVVVGLGLTRFC